MVLGKKSILEHVKNGSIKIEPFSEENLREASAIFTLSSKLLLLNQDGSCVEQHMDEDGFILNPGGFVIGYTYEHLFLSGEMCAIFNTRRAYARVGIDALQTDTFAEPGTNNVLELSIRNGGPFPIKLFPGMLLVKAFFQIVS